MFRDRLGLEYHKTKGKEASSYNPQAEARMRRDTELTDLPIDDVKPATIFRVEF